MTDLQTLAGSATNASTLEDLAKSGATSRGPLINKATQQNMAAHAALLTGGDQAYPAYDKMMTEFNTEQSSQTYDQINLDANKNTNEALKKTMVDVAGNPDVPSDARAQIVASWQENNPAAQERDPQELLAISSVAKDGKTIGDAQVDATRQQVVGHLKAINHYNSEVQKMINGAAIVNDAGVRENVLNFTEMLMPFLEPAAVAKVNLKLRKAIGEDDTSGIAAGLIDSMVLLGESKMSIKGVLEKLPIEKRLPMAQTLYSIVTESNGTIIPGGKNSMIVMNNLRDFLEEGHYTLGDRILDDLGSVADVVGLGGFLRSGKTAAKGAKIEAAAKAASVTGHSPISAASTLANTNDKSFVDVLKMADQDKTGKVSETLFHSSREDALANSIGPEIGMPDGSVRHKPMIDDEHFNPDMEAAKQITSGRGNLEFTKEEKASKLASIKQDITNLPNDITARPEMTTIEAVDEGVNIRTVIGPKEGGFTNAIDALDHAKLSMAKYGVVDEELTLLKRGEDGMYHPVDRNVVSAPKPQAVGVEPPVAKDKVRLYHSGQPVGANETGRWVSTDRKYASGYNSDQPLHYIDVPKTDPRVNHPDYPDQGVANGFTFNFKTTPEETAQFKTVERDQSKFTSQDMSDGDYMVGVNHTSRYDPSDPMLAWSVTDADAKLLGFIPRNIFDKMRRVIKGKAGSITQHIFPPSSVIDPKLVNPAVVTADYVANNYDILLKGPAKRFVDPYVALDKVSQGKMEAYFIEANAKSLKFNPGKMAADGFTEAEIDVARKWKELNDTLYYLENADLVRKSIQKGFQMFVSKTDKTAHMVKPLARNTAGAVTHVYDPSIGKVRAISKNELTALYEKGGNVSVARTPIEVDGEAVKHILVEQNATHYNRALREEYDSVLKYRDGHFTIYYKDPIFVRQVGLKTADGSTYDKAVATAGDIKTAKSALADLKKKFPDNEYEITPDRMSMDDQEELMWNARVYSGRTAQRTRGETLMDTSGAPVDHGFKHIDSPVESLNKSMRSIASRIPMQQFLDTAKKRFMQQYADYLPSQNGVKGWPRSIDDLVKPGLEKSQSDFHQAITTFRFIDAQENGFVNLIDDVSKNFFKSLADTAGEKGWGWVERGLRKGESFGPTNFARKSVFKLTLAAGPLRQVVVQSMQALPTILATNPMFMTKLVPQLVFLRFLDRGGDIGDLAKMLGNKIVGLSDEEARQMMKAYEASGLRSSVQAHSMIREDFKDLVTQGALNKTMNVIGKPLDIAQRVGFDAGENLLMKAVWLSEYDLARKAGKAKTAEELANIHVRARALTGNMNKGDELAYNSNMFGTIMQFTQAPHKMLAQVFVGNRQLTKVDRAKLATGYLLTYGTGYGLLYDTIMRFVPSEDKELQDAVAGGVFNYAMNTLLTDLTGEEVKTDFSSSMRLIDVPSVQNMITSIGTMNLEDLFKNNPAGQLTLGENAKLTEFLKSAYRLYKEPDLEMTTDVMVTFGQMFSGVSAMMKARAALEYQKSFNSKGEIVDPDVNTTEAVFKALGMGTQYETQKYAADDMEYKMTGKAAKDVKYLNDQTARLLGREGISEVEIEYIKRIRAVALKAWENDPFMMQLVEADIRKRIKTGEDVLINRYIKLATTTPIADMERLIDKSQLSQEQREALKASIRSMKEKH